jgi:hypothetical protein
MMSDIDKDGEGAAMVDVGGRSWFDAARVSQKRHVTAWKFLINLGGNFREFRT